MNKPNIKQQRAVEIVNFDNTGKVLKAELDMLNKFIKQRKPVLNREGKDIMGGSLSMLTTSISVVLGHLDGRIKELEKLNYEDQGTKPTEELGDK